jgi:hypothetical protein
MALVDIDISEREITASAQDVILKSSTQQSKALRHTQFSIYSRIIKTALIHREYRLLGNSGWNTHACITACRQQQGRPAKSFFTLTEKPQKPSRLSSNLVQRPT